MAKEKKENKFEGWMSQPIDTSTNDLDQFDFSDFLHYHCVIKPRREKALLKYLDSKLEREMEGFESPEPFKVIVSQEFIGPMNYEREWLIQRYREKGYELTLESRDIISPDTGRIKDYVHDLTFRKLKK